MEPTRRWRSFSREICSLFLYVHVTWTSSSRVACDNHEAAACRRSLYATPPMSQSMACDCSSVVTRAANVDSHSTTCQAWRNSGRRLNRPVVARRAPPAEVAFWLGSAPCAPRGFSRTRTLAFIRSSNHLGLICLKFSSLIHPRRRLLWYGHRARC